MKRLFFSAALLIVLLFSVGPLLWQFVTSIKPDAEITRLPPVLPSKPTAAHYTALLTRGHFSAIIGNSTIVALSSTLLSLLVGSLAAYGIAKLQVPYKKLILLLVLTGSLFPPIATVSPLYLIIRGLDLRDTLLGLVLTYTSFSLPLSVWILTNFFAQIPDELYRAARVDGCTALQAFTRVMVPLSAPGMVTAAILVFIFCWNEFLFALTFTVTPASRTVPVEIALFPGLHEIPWGDIAAASIIVTIPAILFVFIFQKRIVEGLTAGAIKG